MYMYSVYGICLNNMFILLPIGLNSANSEAKSVEEVPFMKRLKHLVLKSRNSRIKFCIRLAGDSTEVLLRLDIMES